MSSGGFNRGCFDNWARDYDSQVTASSEFPLAGYHEVLQQTEFLASATPEMSILDLGTGTGNLAGRFLRRGCSVWATDFSNEMLRRARLKFPRLRLALAELREPLPPSFPVRYHRIVSAYAFHHLTLPAKVELVQRLAFSHLRPGGHLVIADIAFESITVREEVRARVGSGWDQEEFYWAAGEFKEAAGHVPVAVRYRQVSFCGGVFVIEPAVDQTSEG